MKKYRFQNTSSLTPWQKYRPFVLLFIGWNFLGYTFWSYATKNAEENNPNFKNLSQAEQLLTIYGDDPSGAKKIKYRLFGSENSEK